MFLFKPELAADDDEEATDDPNLYKREEVVMFIAIYRCYFHSYVVVIYRISYLILYITCVLSCII